MTVTITTDEYTVEADEWYEATFALLSLEDDLSPKAVRALRERIEATAKLDDESDEEAIKRVVERALQKATRQHNQMGVASNP